MLCNSNMAVVAGNHDVAVGGIPTENEKVVMFIHRQYKVDPERVPRVQGEGVQRVEGSW